MTTADRRDLWDRALTPDASHCTKCGHTVSPDIRRPDDTGAVRSDRARHEVNSDDCPCGCVSSFHRVRPGSTSTRKAM